MTISLDRTDFHEVGSALCHHPMVDSQLMYRLIYWLRVRNKAAKLSGERPPIGRSGEPAVYGRDGALHRCKVYRYQTSSVRQVWVSLDNHAGCSLEGVLKFRRPLCTVRNPVLPLAGYCRTER